MARTQWIGVDWDHTSWDNHANGGAGGPMEGFREALDEFHSRGWKVMVHSCNNPGFIRKCCEAHNLPVDAIWGEAPIDHGGKPVCAVYIDDRGVHFVDWDQALRETIELVDGRPVRR